MENRLSKEQLNNCDKAFLVDLVMNLQDTVDSLNSKMDLLLEQVMISKTKQFQKQSETSEQLSFFNEAESLKADIEEPSLEIVVPSYTRKRPKGKRDMDLSSFPVRIENHELTDNELKEIFPDGYKHLPDEIYKKLDFHPASFEVIEHHIKVYGDKKSDKIVRAEHPKEMLNNSIATPSLTAAIINSKYTNQVPLYRQEQEFERNDVHISRQVMANWVISVSERYISLVYDRLKKELLKSKVVHADETPVMVTKDDREGMHKNYMWVYRTGSMCDAKQLIIYDYQKTRKQDMPRKFLEGFKGNLVCDGYQVYHSLEDERPDEIKVAGCWAHARRRFANVVKTTGAEKAKGSLASTALDMIAKIYHMDNMLLDLPKEERLEKRKLQVKPLVESLFTWARTHKDDVLPNSETGKGFTYLLNQEKYLKTFLDDPEVPLDNNLAEIAIRSFCVGKKNWKLIDTVHGAEASAMLYSIVETAKANSLKIYDYFCYLLTEIPKHMDETNLAFIEDLLPWSENLPDKCRKKAQ